MKSLGVYVLLVMLLMVSCDSRPDAEVKTGEGNVDSLQSNPPNAEQDQVRLNKEYYELTDSMKKELYGYGINVEKGVPVGLKVGDMAPVFKQKTLDGKELFLPDVYKKGPVILFFYRGQWCPICTKYMAAFQDSLSMLTDKGATVIAVAPETSTNAKKTVDETGAKFHVIPDANGLIMNAFRVSFFVTDEYDQKIIDKYNDGTSIGQNNGMKDAKLPVPATFLIDSKGKIRWRHFDPNYKNRASVKSMLEALEELK